MTTEQAIESTKTKENYYNECRNFAYNYVRRLKPGSKFTSEDIIENYNGQDPAEPRVWGAVIRALSQDAMIHHAGWTTYRGGKGHNKPSRIWRKPNL